MKDLKRFIKQNKRTTIVFILCVIFVILVFIVKLVFFPAEATARPAISDLSSFMVFSRSMRTVSFADSIILPARSPASPTIRSYSDFASVRAFSRILTDSCFAPFSASSYSCFIFIASFWASCAF